MKRILFALIICLSASTRSQCLPPLAPNIVDFTSNSATVVWTPDGDQTLWHIIAVPSGSPAPLVTTMGFSVTEVNPFTIVGLMQNTCYDFYIRSACANNLSQWLPAGSGCTLGFPACGGNYIDNGGINANYASNSNEMITMCPDSPGDFITVSFSQFDTEANWDGILVYNGNSTNSPQISSDNGFGNGQFSIFSGAYWGNTLPGPFSSTSPDGCLTFHFISDNAGTRPGWVANISCGPPLNSLELFAFFDANGNGTKDASEEFFTKGSYEVSTVAGTQVFPYYSSDGYAVIPAEPTETYTVSFQIDTEFSSAFTTEFPLQTDIMITGVTPVYFPVVAANPFSNMEVFVYGGSYPNAGTTHHSILHFANTGNTTMSGTLNFITDPALPLMYTTPFTENTPTGFSVGYVLDPFEHREIDVYTTVPAIPTVSMGQLVHYSAEFAQPDDNLADNSYAVTQSIVASYDPNDIAEARGPQIDIDDFTADDYLYYTIRFQNTGNAPAWNVRLENTLNGQIDAESFRVVAASHDYLAERNGSQLTFRFDNINLPFEDQSSLLSQGYVIYKVKLNPGFAVGDIVPNVAEIYFDSNPAIITNTFETEFVTELGAADFNSTRVLIYPNPASQNVAINTLDNTKINTIRVFDMLGKLISVTGASNSSQQNLDISKFSKGIYLVEITGDRNLKTVKKLIVE